MSLPDEFNIPNVFIFKEVNDEINYNTILIQNPDFTEEEEKIVKLAHVQFYLLYFFNPDDELFNNAEIRHLLEIGDLYGIVENHYEFFKNNTSHNARLTRFYEWNINIRRAGSFCATFGLPIIYIRNQIILCLPEEQIQIDWIQFSTIKINGRKVDGNEPFNNYRNYLKRNQINSINKPFLEPQIFSRYHTLTFTNFTIKLPLFANFLRPTHPTTPIFIKDINQPINPNDEPNTIDDVVMLINDAMEIYGNRFYNNKISANGNDLKYSITPDHRPTCTRVFKFKRRRYKIELSRYPIVFNKPTGPQENFLLIEDTDNNTVIGYSMDFPYKSDTFEFIDEDEENDEEDNKEENDEEDNEENDEEDEDVDEIAEKMKENL